MPKAEWERLEQETVRLESMANAAETPALKTYWLDRAKAMRKRCQKARREVDDLYRRNTQ